MPESLSTQVSSVNEAPDIRGSDTEEMQNLAIPPASHRDKVLAMNSEAARAHMPNEFHPEHWFAVPGQGVWTEFGTRIPPLPQNNQASTGYAYCIHPDGTQRGFELNVPSDVELDLTHHEVREAGWALTLFGGTGLEAIERDIRLASPEVTEEDIESIKKGAEQTASFIREIPMQELVEKTQQQSLRGIEQWLYSTVALETDARSHMVDSWLGNGVAHA